MTEEVFIAKGGVCAPISPLYDLDRPGYEYPDHPYIPSWDLVVAPRLTRSIAVGYEARRRLRAAWRALTTPLPEYDEDDDW